ncbi:UvrD-helicase domain-containing protein [Megalodesulfovibrio paquesii]
MQSSPSAFPSAAGGLEFLALRASAGSGKTYALTSRFLRLLHGASPDTVAAPSQACARQTGPLDWSAILAVTFTNKAAAEMQERVLRALKERALNLEKSQHPDHPAQAWTPSEARRWCEIILHRMSRLNIRTIDSLLFQLVRLSALPLGLAPDIEPVFEEDALFEPLYDRLVDRARQDSALAARFEKACRNALDYGTAKGFAPALSLKERLAEILSFLAASPQPFDLHADEESLVRRLEAMRLDCQEAARRMVDDIAAAGLNAQKNFLNYLDKVQGMSVFEALPSGVWPDKDTLDDCLNKASKGHAGSAAEASFAALQARLRRYRERQPIYKDARELLPMAALAGILAPELQAMERRLSLLPKSRWEPLVCRLFEDGFGVSEAYCRLGVRLTHLLIDEFQDTSRSQWQALEPLAVEALAKGGSLFYVGDVKQAIYGWRGGDARLFDELPHREELQGFRSVFQPCSLDKNWRSAPVVVDINNQLFSLLEDADVALDVATAMLPKADADLAPQLARDIQTSFHNTAQHVPTPYRSNNAGLFQLLTVTGEDADAVLQATREAVETVLDDVLARRPYGEVAVLVRSNDQAQTVAQWLLDRGVPVVTENSLLLNAHPLIRQLLQFLAFLEFPPDDLAFWEVISGQELFLDASGLTHREMVDWLARVRSEREGGDASGGSAPLPKPPLFICFRRDFPEAWQRWLQPFHRQAGILGPYDCLAELCRRFRLLDRRPGDQLFLRRLLEVAHLAETSGQQSLSAFLEYWISKGDTERAPLPDGLDAVRILTIHKAKGLEFPAVLIPFHHDTARLDKDLLLVDPEEPSRPPEPEGAALLARRRRELGPVFQEARRDSLMEALHVLYVAWTRAAEELHCVVAPSRASQSPMTKALLTLLPCLGILENAGTEACVVRMGQTPEPTRELADGPGTVEQPDASLDSAPFAPASTEPAAAFRPMDWLPRLKVFRNELAPANFANRRRGTMLHRCLEHLHLPSPAPTPQEAAQAIQRALDAGLRGLANPHDPAAFARDRDTVAGEVRERLEWLLAQEEARPWLCHGLREITLLDNQGDLHKPDLIVLEAPAPLAVDYKSGLPRDKDTAQVRRYLQLLAAMHPELPQPEGRLIYLDMQVIQPVRLVQA